MANFMIRFLICNVFISGIIGILLIAKQIFKNNLSSRMQYNLWFLLLGLLAVPFIPFRLIGFPQIFSWLGSLRCSPASGTATAMGEAVGINPTGNTDWMNDFSLSVNSETPSIAGYILLGIWIVGIFAMIILVIKSSLLYALWRNLHFPFRTRKSADYIIDVWRKWEFTEVFPFTVPHF